LIKRRSKQDEQGWRSSCSSNYSYLKIFINSPKGLVRYRMNILMKKPRLQTHLPDIPLLILSR
jgi:hypothetical protein